MDQHDGGLLAEVEGFLIETGMAATRLGREALADGNVVPRLRGGKGITLANAEKLRRFMAFKRVQQQHASAP